MKKICCICGEAREINILIRGKMICSECEWKIVKSKVHNKGYDELVRRLSDQVTVEAVNSN